jgi:hypothetical protein
VPRGVVQASYRSDSGEYFYTLDVPERYDPRASTRSACSCTAASAASKPAHRRVPDRTAGCRRRTDLRHAVRLEDAPWWSGARSKTFARFSIW